MQIEAFVEARGPALVRTAYLLTGDPYLAEDLVQTALLKCWRHWDRVAQMDQPEAYVRRVLVNAYVSHQRLRRNSETPADTMALSLTGETTAATTERVEDRQVLRLVLHRLSRRERVVLVLRYYLDLDDQAIADSLGVTTSTVRSTSSRALTRARQLWADPAVPHWT